MEAQNNEFSAFKVLLKQVYSVHTSKVKELESEIKVLKDKLQEKDRLLIEAAECKRCAELENAFKSCKQALYEQSKLFESFGRKFSIFNSSEQESQESKFDAKLSAVESQNTKLSTNINTFSSKLKNDSLNLSFISNNQNLLKNVMCDNGSFDSFDAYTVTFPEHLKNNVDLKPNSIILAPDTLEVINNLKNSPEKKAKNKSEKNESVSSNNNEIQETVKASNQIMKTVKRSSSESLSEERPKKCNRGDQIINGKSNHDNIKNSKCDADLENDSTLVNHSTENNLKKLNKNNSQTVKKGNIVEATMITDCKFQNPKNSNSENKLNDNKKAETPSPSLLPANAKNPPIINIECISNDNEDFQEHVPTSKIQMEDSWDTCDKKKAGKKNRILKTIKCTSKFKMTLDSPSLNHKRPNYKQTKLSDSLFQGKQQKELCDNFIQIDDSVSSKESENELPIILNPPFTSTQREEKPSNTVDIDATFVPDNFKYEITQCGTASVKKNTVEKSHLKNGSLFSCISFPGGLKTCNDEERSTNSKDKSAREEDEVTKENRCSFDRLPAPEEPNYKYINEAVRKKAERKQLNAFDCKECEKYYSELGLSDKEKKERMKKCSRHRAKYSPPNTPDHFWELDFPDTEECKARGYLDKTQKVKLKNLCDI